jgi:hypothetical protein
MHPRETLAGHWLTPPTQSPAAAMTTPAASARARGCAGERERGRRGGSDPGDPCAERRGDERAAGARRGLAARRAGGAARSSSTSPRSPSPATGTDEEARPSSPCAPPLVGAHTQQVGVVDPGGAFSPTAASPPSLSRQREDATGTASRWSSQAGGGCWSGGGAAWGWRRRRPGARTTRGRRADVAASGQEQRRSGRCRRRLGRSSCVFVLLPPTCCRLQPGWLAVLHGGAARGGHGGCRREIRVRRGEWGRVCHS